MWFVDDVIAKQNEELKKEKDRLSFLTNQLGREKAILVEEKRELESEKKSLEQKLKETQDSLKRSRDGKLFLKLDLDAAKNEASKIGKQLLNAEEKVFFWRERAFKSANEALDARMRANNLVERDQQRSRELSLKVEIAKQKTLNTTQMLQIHTRDDRIKDLERIVTRQRVELVRRFQEVKRIQDEMDEILASLACRGINMYEGRTLR